jgi:hypothetical protein
MHISIRVTTKRNHLQRSWLARAFGHRSGNNISSIVAKYAAVGFDFEQRSFNSL